MVRMLAHAIGLVYFVLACGAMADSTDWPYPEDIPKIDPVTVGLAGEVPADIVRYLMAAGASLHFTGHPIARALSSPATPMATKRMAITCSV